MFNYLKINKAQFAFTIKVKCKDENSTLKFQLNAH